MKQHTQLDGGIITSSQSAEDKGKNQFSTGTLAHSDIQNHSHYEGKSFGLGASVAVSGKTLGQGEQNNPQESRLKTVADKNGTSSSIGYGNDSDSQSSVTKSGINTKNIQITDEDKQIQLTGKTAEETKAQIHTNTTTETAQAHSGSLKNSFDKEAVQSELDLQRTVSQSFNQNVQAANTEINKHLDNLKTKLDDPNISAAEKAEIAGQINNWQRGQVLLNSIASGLTAPTQSTAGIMAATASPALSYEIGQHFKGKNAEGTSAHILAHAVLGAAVAAAGDNNALAGAISAGGAEAAAPYISKWLYDKEKGSDLTAEEKETVSAITNLLGTATGAVIGDTTANAVQGSLNAQNAVENNNGARGRRNTRNPLWTDAQTRQNELNAARINSLTEQIRRIEPNFKGIASLRDPARPIPNEEVKAYEVYLNTITFNKQSTNLNNQLFTNHYPSDAVVNQFPIRTLIRDSNGRFWLRTQNGKLLTPSGHYDFVVMPNGNILVSRQNANPDFSTHLGLSGGRPVKFAGGIRFTNNNSNQRGQIIYWNNHSGHYKPFESSAPNAGLPMQQFKSLR